MVEGPAIMEANVLRDCWRDLPYRDDRSREAHSGAPEVTQAIRYRSVAETERRGRRSTAKRSGTPRGGTGMRRMVSAGRKSSASAMSTRPRKSRRRRATTFVVCVENSGYPASLELHKIYRVVSDQDAQREGDLRIVDESGEDYLYPAEWFATVEVPRRVRASLLGRPTRLQSA